MKETPTSCMIYFASNQIVKELRRRTRDRLRKLARYRPRKPFWARPTYSRKSHPEKPWGSPKDLSEAVRLNLRKGGPTCLPYPYLA